jgi:peptide deformylase
MNATVLRIRLFGDSALRKKAKPVKEITTQHQEILNAMAKLMSEASGIGLAAPQVGINEAMIVVDVGSGLYKLINPKVIKRQGSQAMEEGCLSIPGICIKVKRAKKVWVEAEDENAKVIKIEAEDLLACVIQHEIEHLKGRLIIDYASFFERLKIKQKLNEIRKRSKDETMSEPKTKSQPILQL